MFLHIALPIVLAKHLHGLLGKTLHLGPKKDDATGDVVLSNQPGARVWDTFFELVHAVGAPDEFMVERLLNDLSQGPGVFDDEASPQRNQEC